MARIAIVLAHDFEDSEFEIPHRRLTEAGHDVSIVGEKVVKNRNLITSRKPDDLDAFCKVILDELTSRTRA